MFTEDDYRTAEEFLMLYCPRPDSEIKGVLPDGWDENTAERDLDIIIPCYNVEKYVRQCLDSVVPYPFRQNTGIFLIDDGSTDGTGEILDSYGKYPNVRVIHQENKGLSGARNTGIRASSSRYFFFIDSDDYIVPEKVEKMLSYAMEKKADSVRGLAFNVFEDQIMELGEEAKTGVFQEIPPLDAAAYAWGTVLNAGLFRELCFPEGYLFEDVVMHLLLSPMCRKSYLYYYPLYAYRMNPEGITAKSRYDAKAVHSFWLLKLMLETLAKKQISIDEGLYARILSHIAQTHLRIAQLEDQVKVAVFIATCKTMKELNHRLQPEDKYRQLFQKAMLAEDYALYDQISHLIYEALKVGA